MATSRHGTQLALLAAAMALVLLIGSSDAWDNCPEGFKNCDYKPGCETCVKSDVNNCGSCGYKCPPKSNTYVSCVNYKCVYTCKPNYANCDNDWSNGCEKYISNDPYNCGQCGKVCPTYANTVAKCSGGSCSTVCKPLYGDCDGNKYNGCEKNLSYDVLNCGYCGHKCPCTLKYGIPTCSNGACGQTCPKNWKYDSVKKCCVQGY